jgi:glycosidase
MKRLLAGLLSLGVLAGCSKPPCKCLFLTDGGPDAGPDTSEVAVKPRIYQLLVRHFGNANTTNAYDGDLATNGSGKLADINDAALDALKGLGVTHLWLTGVVRQATLSDFSSVDPALGPDDPDIVKGKAGSPYAVRDYFDVSPEIATVPANRVAEFKALVARIHAHGLKAVIDFVPNHVSRGYKSVVKPELDFGLHDDPSQFFSPQNHFFYLAQPAGQALQLSYPPGAPVHAGQDGRFGPEDGTTLARTPKATGDNLTSPNPSANDWYEVVKLNYGFNFVDRTTHYDPQPALWGQMDQVLSHWQGLGVDGFRCDFSHWIPVEFWSWAIGRAKARQPAYFFAEAYDNPDAAPGYSKAAFVRAGFDALYDSAAYNTVKGIYASTNWANDLEQALPAADVEGHLLRYAENHDERRAASPVTPGDPGNSGFGTAQAGFAVTALLHLLGPEPTLVYAGQELGEKGAGREGFGGDDGRTSIFDYWSPPALAAWSNGHAYDGAQLNADAKDLRAQYVALGAVLAEPAFSGKRFSLQPANKAQAAFGEQGHWVYGFLRFDPDRGQTFLVLANLNPSVAYTPKVKLPTEAMTEARLDPAASYALVDRWSALNLSASGAELTSPGVVVDLPALTVRVLEIKKGP